MRHMFAGYPSPSPPPISPPAYPPLPPDPPGNPPYPPYPPFSPPGNCSAGYEYNPESMVNGGCMIVVAAWVVYVLLGCGCCCCFALCCGCCYKADSICPAERRPTAMMRRSTALAPLHNRASQFAAEAKRRSSLGMRRGSQKEATPAEAPRRSRSPTDVRQGAPRQMAALEAEAAKEAAPSRPSGRRPDYRSVQGVGAGPRRGADSVRAAEGGGRRAPREQESRARGRRAERERCGGPRPAVEAAGSRRGGRRARGLNCNV